MPTDNFISPTPEGSARSIDIQMNNRWSAANALTGAGENRGGVPFGIIGSASNWGLGGTDNGTLVLYKGAAAYSFRGGANSHESRIPLVTTRPVALTKWRMGLYIIEIVMAWPTNQGGDNGLQWGFAQVGNLRPSVGQCFQMGNNGAGVLTFTMRGPTGTQTTAIAGVTTTEWTKIRVELRNATVNTDATVNVFVNDSPSANISKNSADANFPAIAAAPSCLMAHCVGVGSATEFIYVRDWTYFAGPNTQLGML